MKRREFLRGLVTGIAAGLGLGAVLPKGDYMDPVLLDAHERIQDPFRARWITLEEFQRMYPNPLFTGELGSYHGVNVYEGHESASWDDREECKYPARAHDGVWRHDLQWDRKELLALRQRALAGETGLTFNRVPFSVL
jgi:hypothetical protein